MKPSARIQTVIEVLETIASRNVPMNATIGDYVRGRRYIGSKDRAYIADTTYNLVRAHARLGWWLNKLKLADTPRTRMLLWLALEEKYELFRISNLFEGAKYAPAPLTEDEQSWLAKVEGQELTPAEMPEVTAVECPPAYEATLRAYFGESFAAEMKAFIAGATLDLRVNTTLIERDKVQASLAKEGVETTPTPYSPWGLRVDGKTFLSRTKAFQKGWVDIQDEGSQLIAYLCQPQPGQQVLDYCAGAGGKTLALAAMMENKGRIVACDIDPDRLQKARPRFRRAHVHDIIEVRPLSENRHRKWLRRQKGTFDVVLTDVPCSGTGTWRRNPDGRWENYGPSLTELLTIQTEILDKAAQTVKEGGRLIYATCSLLPEENEDQITDFLARNDDFKVVPLSEAWPEGSAPNDGPYMRLTPHQHNTDGFFAAVLSKNAPAA